jgi:hypothetical protein
MADKFYKLSQELAARPDLSASAKVVYSVLADRMGQNGEAWPGHRRLAKDTGLHRETVKESIARLVATGLLSVEKRGNGQVNHYWLLGETGRKNQPVPVLSAEENRSENPAGPVGNQPDNPTPGGRKIQPEPAGNSVRNQTDQIRHNAGHFALEIERIAVVFQHGARIVQPGVDFLVRLLRAGIGRPILVGREAVLRAIRPIYLESFSGRHPSSIRWTK